MVEIPKISNKEAAKIEREIDMIGERHVFQLGERVKIIRLPDECKAPGQINDPCDIINKFGTVLSINSNTNKLIIVFDHLVACRNTFRNACLIHETNVESMRSRIIFSIHPVVKITTCGSINCQRASNYIIYEYVKGNSFEVCPTHAIEWFNQQYRQMADILTALNRQLKKNP